MGICELLACRAATTRVGLGLTLDAKLRVRHRLEPRERYFVAAILAVAKVFGFSAQPVNCHTHPPQHRRVVRISIRGDRLQHFNQWLVVFFVGFFDVVGLGRLELASAFDDELLLEGFQRFEQLSSQRGRHG